MAYATPFKTTDTKTSLCLVVLTFLFSSLFEHSLSVVIDFFCNSILNNEFVCSPIQCTCIHTRTHTHSVNTARGTHYRAIYLVHTHNHQSLSLSLSLAVSLSQDETSSQTQSIAESQTCTQTNTNHTHTRPEE